MSTAAKATPSKKDAWKKAKTHTVTLPSGAVIDIQVPDLARLIETGEIPQNLLDVALSVAQTGRIPEPTPELAVKLRSFTDMVVMKTVVDPALAEEDMPDIPYEDKDMIVQLAMRERDLDAMGAHIGGLHKSAEFRAFRGLRGVDSTVEDI